jgi:hypothetical protein
VSSYNLAWLVSLEGLRTRIPCRNISIWVKHKDGVVLNGFDQYAKGFVHVKALLQLELPLALFGGVNEFHLDKAQSTMVHNWNSANIPSSAVSFQVLYSLYPQCVSRKVNGFVGRSVGWKRCVCEQVTHMTPSETLAVARTCNGYVAVRHLPD